MVSQDLSEEFDQYDVIVVVVVGIAVVSDVDVVAGVEDGVVGDDDHVVGQGVVGVVYVEDAVGDVDDYEPSVNDGDSNDYQLAVHLIMNEDLSLSYY